MKISKTFHGLTNKKIIERSSIISSGSDWNLFKDNDAMEFCWKYVKDCILITDKSRSNIVGKVTLKTKLGEL